MAKKKVALSYGHGANTYEDKRSKFVKVDGKIYEEHTHNATVGVIVRDGLKAHGFDVLEVQPPNGKDVDLTTRTNKANAWGADVYYSIHSNAGAASAKGYCAFFWSTSKDSKKLAELYAKNIKEYGFGYYSGGTEPSVKGTWTDFHEVRESNMTAILTENGFMTNKDDFKLIFTDKAAQKKEAYAHIKTICDYFGVKYDPYKSGEKVKTASKPAATPTTGTHKVVKGDTLWSLSQKYNTTVAKLKELNGLKSDTLSIGDTLKVTGSAVTHRVERGDTLYSLAKANNTTVAKIKELNGLKSDTLTIGDTLRLK